MSQKFSIVIEVGKDGKPITTGYVKAEANQASAHFIRLRDAGREAYFFQHPIADRRCKSIEQVNITRGQRDAEGNFAEKKDGPALPDPAAANTIPMPAPKRRKGNTIEGVSLDIEAGGPMAIDM